MKCIRINLTEIFYKTVSSNPKILAPKKTQFLVFSEKIIYFDQIEHISDTFDLSYVNTPGINYFPDIFKKNESFPTQYCHL